MGAPKGYRYNRYMDPQICPRCMAPAEIIFGARRYCAPCAEDLRAFSDAMRARAEAA